MEHKDLVTLNNADDAPEGGLGTRISQRFSDVGLAEPLPELHFHLEGQLAPELEELFTSNPDRDIDRQE